MKNEVQALGEITESEAEGSTKQIYDSIKKTAAVPMVSLIYRHLATVPNCLQWMWSVLGPFMESRYIPWRSEQLANEIRISAFPDIQAEALYILGLKEEDLSSVRNILDAYNRANPVNLICANILRILLEGDFPNTRSGVSAMLEVSGTWAPRIIPSLPKMLAIQDLDEKIYILIRELKGPSDQTTGLIWPSLYRHLSIWPNYFALAATLLRPFFKSDKICRVAENLRVAAIKIAQEIAEKLPRPDKDKCLADEQRAILVETLAAFVRKIPEMIVVGNLLRWSLPERTIRKP